MMKHLSFILLYSLCLLSTVACQAADQVVMSVEVDAPAEAAKKLNIDNVYRMIQVKHRQYYAGFSIDAGGINHAVLIEVGSDGKPQNRWFFEDIISDIFIFNGRVSVVLDTGQSLSLVRDAWVKNPQSLSQNARVVFSNGERHLIVCSPSSVFKAGAYDAGCESYNPHWKVSFPWQDVEPKLCGDYLYAVTWEQKQNQRLAINGKSGEIRHKAAYSGEALCTPFN